MPPPLMGKPGGIIIRRGKAALDTEAGLENGKVGNKQSNEQGTEARAKSKDPYILACAVPIPVHVV